MGAAVGFALLASHVVSGFADPIDQSLTDTIQVHVSPRVRWFLRYFTRLGQLDVMTVATATPVLLCLRRRRKALAAMWTFTMLAGYGLTQLLKVAIARTRPRYAEAFLPIDDSFPSGHTSMTLVFVGFALYLFLRRERSAVVTWAAVIGAVLWSGLMGLSRLLLGNHYLSDVLGGYLLGTAWLAVVIGGTEYAVRSTTEGRGAKDEPTLLNRDPSS